VRGILIADRPADAAYLPNPAEVRLTNVVTAEARLSRAPEGRALPGVTVAVPGHVPEVVLVQHHAVVFKAEAAGQLRVGGDTPGAPCGPPQAPSCLACARQPRAGRRSPAVAARAPPRPSASNPLDTLLPPAP